MAFELWNFVQNKLAVYTDNLSTNNIPQKAIQIAKTERF